MEQILGRITEDTYDKFYNDFSNILKDTLIERENLQKAENDFFLTTNYILQLANRAHDLFKSSKPEQKRKILKLLLGNLQLDGRIVRYDLLKPFDEIFILEDRSLVLPRLDSNQGP